MLTKVQRWCNRLALRIPKAFATDARIENDTVVEVSSVDGRLEISGARIQPGQKPGLESTTSRVSVQIAFSDVRGSIAGG